MKDGDVLAQIETDKVTIDVKYTEAQPGVVSKVLIAADDTVEVGQDCFIVDVGATGGKEAPAKEEAAPPPKEEKKAEAQPPPPPPKEEPKQAAKLPSPPPKPAAPASPPSQV